MKDLRKIKLFIPYSLCLGCGQETLVGGSPFLKENTPLFLKAQPEHLRVGDLLGEEEKEPLFQIKDIQWKDIEGLKQRVYTLKVKRDRQLDKGWRECIRWREGYTLAIITLSDKGFEGEREDLAGPLVEKKLKEKLPITMCFRSLIGDHKYELLNLFMYYALTLRVDIIVTTGGTGVTSRDITPEVSSQIIEKRLPGFEYRLFSSGIKKTPHAIISRAICGILHSTLIINLPGSPKGAGEGIEAISNALPHTLDKLQDDPTECGSLP